MKPVWNVLLASWWVGWVGGSIFAQPATQPIMAEIQTDFDSQRYAQVVRKAQTALGARGNAAVGLDRAQLLNLRAESYLRLKQFPNASAAFAAAAKETSDSTKASTWTATQLLISRSPGGTYTPRQGGRLGATRGEPIDIVEPESRKAAFEALFSDELTIARPKINALAGQGKIPPLIEGIKQAASLRGLELAGTGSDAASKELIDDLGDKASQLMGDELRNLSMKVEQISRTANETTVDATISQRTGTGVVNTQKRGVTTTDIRELNNVRSICSQIAAACDQLSVAAGSDRLFSTIKEDAARLMQQAYDVMNASYGGDTNVRIQRGRSGGY